MALATNIVTRKHTYYARVAVPVDLQAHLGRKEVWRSLKTKDPHEARRRGLAAVTQLHEEWAALRHKREPSEVELQRAVVGFYHRELEIDRRERLSLPNQGEVELAEQKLHERLSASKVVHLDPRKQAFAHLSDIVEFTSVRDKAEDDRHRREMHLRTLRTHLGRQETALVQWAADEIVERERLELDRSGPIYKDLCQRLLRAWIQALERAEERDRGNYAGKPTDPIVEPPAGPVPVVAPPGESVAELYEQFVLENPKGVKADTLNQNGKIMELFIESVGRSFPASRVTKKEVRDWKALLMKFPIKAAESKAFKGVNLREVVKLNASIGKPTLTNRTINKYLSALGAFCQWLINEGQLDNDPVGGLYLHVDRETPKVLPYTAGELQRLFSSPLFVGCESRDVLHKPGTARIRDHRYWLPLLGLFTGARLGELAQLDVADVRQEHGHWIIHVTRVGGKSTKTKGSQRVIPVHPELVQLGFIAYHGRLKRQGEKRLFPAVQADARGQISGEPSREYGRYIQRIGLKDDKTKNFHSFRHGMADAFRAAGFRDEEFGFLLGHTQATTTGRYGILPEGDLEKRVKMINAVKFPGLDLSHLYPATRQAAE